MSDHNNPNKIRFNKIQLFLLDSLAKASAKMSVDKKRRIANLLCTIMYDLFGMRKKYVISRLRSCLKIDPVRAGALARKTYQNFLLNSIEMAGLRYFSNQELLDKVQISGLENLKKALSDNKGAIIVSGHFGLWELVPPWFALNGFPTNVVVRRQNNKEVDKWMEEMRNKHGAKTTDSGYAIREILRALKKGEILALMVDQDNGKKGIFVKFFDKLASAPVGPAQISLKTGAPIVPLAMFPDYSYKHHLKIVPPIYPKDFENSIKGQQELTQKFTTFLEGLVEQAPEQWFWLHRRWKTQPEDCPENPWV